MLPSTFGRFCQAVHDAECAVHSHSAVPQASCSWHGDTATGTRNVQNTAQASDILTSGLPASIFLPLLDIFCTSQLMCQLCHLLKVSEGSVSLCLHPGTCHEFTVCLLGSAALSELSLGLCHSGCCLPSHTLLCARAFLQCRLLIY